MAKSLNEKILEDIEKTGFVTELETVSKFLKRGWTVDHSPTFEDFDFKISREIDLIARKNIFDWDSKAWPSITLVIEVKKDTKRPWVIFSSPQDNFPNDHLGWNLLHVAQNYKSKNIIDSDSSLKPINIFENTVLDEPDFFKLPRNFGRAFHEAFKPPQEKSKIYESLLTVSKATWYSYRRLIDNQLKSYRKATEWKHENSTYLDIFIPIVLLDGQLFEVKLSAEGEKDLTEVDYIPVSFIYSSPNYVEEFNQINFYPLIAQANSIEMIMERMESWLESIKIKMEKVIEERIEYFGL